MADTGCDIMLITVRMAKGMKFSIVPSNTKVHTSVSGQSSVLGEVADSFDMILMNRSKSVQHLRRLRTRMGRKPL
jgi:hypothetical protein